MPIYEYECEKGHVFEMIERVGGAETTDCKTCGGHAHRILSPTFLVFKGPGFYVNDYKKKAQPAEASAGNGDSPSKTAGKDSKSGGNGSKPDTDTKGVSSSS